MRARHRDRDRSVEWGLFLNHIQRPSQMLRFPSFSIGLGPMGWALSDVQILSEVM